MLWARTIVLDVSLITIPTEKTLPSVPRSFRALCLPVICVETRHMQAALKAQINKTDRNDARGIAQMMRGRTLSSGAREDVTQSEASDAPDHRKLLQSQFNRQASLLH